MNKVTKEDLKGEIADFPLEVVQWMCEQQVVQGNEFNPEIFQESRNRDRTSNGITWSRFFDTNSSGQKFGECVIRDRKFDVFFKRFSKSETEKDRIKVRVLQKDNHVCGDHYNHYNVHGGYGHFLSGHIGYLVQTIDDNHYLIELLGSDDRNRGNVKLVYHKKDLEFFPIKESSKSAIIDNYKPNNKQNGKITIVKSPSFSIIRGIRPTGVAVSIRGCRNAVKRRHSCYREIKTAS